MDLVILSLDLVTKTIHDVWTPSPNFHTTPLSLDRYHPSPHGRFFLSSPKVVHELPIMRGLGSGPGLVAFLLTVMDAADTPPHAFLAAPLRFAPPPCVRHRLLRVGGGSGCGSRVSDRGLPCHEFKPSTTKDPPCRAAMHAKSVELKRPPVGVVW
ncbi:hypothetical protein TNCV_2654561 [Trichonephila clavipes]|nr:hypothetical protein TNCV_2654561 [Trichonephila clavipes]